MNALHMINFFNLCLLSGVFAALNKLSKSQIYGQLRTVIESGEETLEQVKAILENADEDLKNDLTGLNLLFHFTNREVFEYFLSESVNLDPIERVRKITDALALKLYSDRKNIFEVTPDEPDFAIICAGLNELKGIDNFEKCDKLYAEYLRLFGLGNLALIKKFVEAGFKVPLQFPEYIRADYGLTVETLLYLANSGYSLYDDGDFICFQMKKVTPANFQVFLDHGLPLDYQFMDDNWLALSLEKDCIDIAELVYKKGLRLTKGNELRYSKYQNRMDELVKRLAISFATDEAAKIAHVQAVDPTSILNFIPRDIIINELAKPLYHLAVERINLFQ